MVVDYILDRKAGIPYNAHDFYMYCMEESGCFGGMLDEITRAMDEGEEVDVRRELCNYIKSNGYNKRICKYINSVNWLE
jgi:NH3-dependent NAD+ synthetase